MQNGLTPELRASGFNLVGVLAVDDYDALVARVWRGGQPASLSPLIHNFRARADRPAEAVRAPAVVRIGDYSVMKKI